MKRLTGSQVGPLAPRWRTVGGAALPFLAVFFTFSAASAQPVAVLTDELEEATATVTAIDPQERLVSLETEDGRELTVEAGDEVRNFDQIEVGDRVDVAFYEAFMAEVTEAPVGGGDEPVIVRRAARRSEIDLQAKSGSCTRPL